MSKDKENDKELLHKLNTAVAAMNKAATRAEEVKTELVSKSKAVGMVLLEVKKRHPNVKDFDAFLKKAKGLQLSRAYDCMAIAGGRKTDAENREQIRNRVEKHRAKKLPPPLNAEPEQSPESPLPPPPVTSSNVTESAEVSAADRQQDMAAIAGAELTREEKSDDALVKFKQACEQYCNEMIEADLKNARVYFNEQRWRRRDKKKAA